MEPITIGTVITSLIPTATTLVKKLLKTDNMQPELKKGINTIIPLVLGILSTGLYALSLGADWKLALGLGFGSGAVAQNLRDLNKRFNIISALVDKSKKA